MEKREVDLFGGLKSIYDEADRQGAFDPIKENFLIKLVATKRIIMILSQVQMYLRKRILIKRI